MAQYWYKKDKRVKRLGDNDENKDVIRQVKDLKSKGYVRVLDRRSPENTIVEQPKPKKKVKAKVSTKKK